MHRCMSPDILTFILHFACMDLTKLLAVKVLSQSLDLSHTFHCIALLTFEYMHLQAAFSCCSLRAFNRNMFSIIIFI